MTAVFAIGGAFLAWLWFAGYWVLAVAIAATIWLAAVGAQEYGRRLIRSNPNLALKFLEKRLLAVGAASATAAAVAIVIAVELSAPKDAAASTEELLGAVSSALAAFFVGLTVAGEDADGRIGEFVMQEFQKQYCGERDQEPGDRCKLPSKSDAYLALYSGYERGWTDWSGAIRRKRIDELAKYMKQHPEVVKQS